MPSPPAILKEGPRDGWTSGGTAALNPEECDMGHSTDLGTWRTTAHDRGDERCLCTVCGPPPTLTVYDALRSPEKRRERDLQVARRMRMAPDEVGPFLERLALYDVREQARVQEEAVARLTEATRQRETVEARGDLTRLRGKGVVRRLPRPRAA